MGPSTGLKVSPLSLFDTIRTCRFARFPPPSLGEKIDTVIDQTRPSLPHRSYSSLKPVSKEVPYFPRRSRGLRGHDLSLPTSSRGTRAPPNRSPPSRRRQAPPYFATAEPIARSPNPISDAAPEAQRTPSASDGTISEVVERLGLDPDIFDDSMDDEKFRAMTGHDGATRINIFDQDEDGMTETANDEAPHSFLDLNEKIRNLEQAVQESEEALSGLDAKDLRSLRKLLLMAGVEEALLPDPPPENEPPKRDLAAASADLAGANKERDEAVVVIREPKIDLAAVLLPRSKWTLSSRHHISQLNDMLVRAGSLVNNGKLGPGTIQKTWKRYSTARHALSLQWKMIPKPTWNLLWAIFNSDAAPHAQRMHRIYTLSKDMAAADMPLTPDQQLEAIEAMFTDGWQEEAISNWKKHVSTLGANPTTLVRYWNLGIQMLCLQGDLERAGRALQSLASSGQPYEPRIMFPYIDACTRHPAYKETAWKAYRRLRDALGSNMEVEDYDEVIDSFLSRNLLEYALYAFVDMMSRGAIDLYSRDRIPGTVANKFFFGKWLKRLIGAGEVDGAAAVVNLMFRKGVRPASIQLNGLIGAWFRAGTVECCRKAEDMAWQMIYSRLDFVEAREKAPIRELKGVLRPVDARAPSFRPPRATSETFALLADFYRDRGSFDKLETLWNVVKAAEIKIDGYLLTPVLQTFESTGREQEAFDLIFRAADRLRLQLTWSTFKPLWALLWRHDGSRSDRQRRLHDITLARRLFSEMVQSTTALLADNSVAPEYMCRLILSTLVSLEDFHGSLIALHTLASRFNMKVTDQMALHVITGYWGVGPRRGASRDSSSRLRLAARDIATFLARRLESTQRHFSSLSAEERSQEMLLYIDRVLSAKIPGFGTSLDVQQAHQAVGAEMGIEYK